MSSRYDPSTGNDLVSTGTITAYNVTNSVPLQIAGIGRLAKISVVVSGAVLGACYDASGIAATGVASEIVPIPSGFPTPNPIVVDMPFTNGLTVVPGSGSTVAVCYQLQGPH